MVPARYFVVRHDKQWRVEFENAYRNGYLTQSEAVAAARDAARDMVRSGRNAEVLVHSDNGIWYTEWTVDDL